MDETQCWTTFEPCFASRNKKIYLKFIFYLFSETVSGIGFEAIFHQKIKNKYQNQKTFYKNTIGVYIYILLKNNLLIYFSSETHSSKRFPKINKK